MRMSNIKGVRALAFDVMAATPAVGLDHHTVVPTNHEPPTEEQPIDAEEAS